MDAIDKMIAQRITEAERAATERRAHYRQEANYNVGVTVSCPRHGAAASMWVRMGKDVPFGMCRMGCRYIGIRGDTLESFAAHLGLELEDYRPPEKSYGPGDTTGETGRSTERGQPAGATARDGGDGAGARGAGDRPSWWR